MTTNKLIKTDTMKAIISTKYGSPDILELQEVNKPLPKDNEILIKVVASSVTTADGMMRTGKPYIGRLFTGMTKPKNRIPGTGFAGVIETVGSSVKKFMVGDEVFGENIATFGTNAEFVCVPEDGVVSIKPKNMTFDEAAPICDGALTSMNFLKTISKIKSGQKVLIIGASGSLGTAGVQIAKYYGAEVTGVCSTTNLDLVKSIGADYVLDYSKEDFTKTSNTYDVIYDTVGKSSFSKCKKRLKKTGVYVSPVLGMSLLGDMITTSMFSSKKAKFSATGMLPVQELKMLLGEVILMIEDEQIKTVIDKRYTMGQIADAHRYIDLGHKKGNTVLVA